MLIGLIVSSLVLKINDSELYYSEPTKCSKRTLNTTSNVNRPNYLFSLFCWYTRPNAFIISSIN